MRCLNTPLRCLAQNDTKTIALKYLDKRKRTNCCIFLRCPPYTSEPLPPGMTAFVTDRCGYCNATTAKSKSNQIKSCLFQATWPIKLVEKQ